MQINGGSLTPEFQAFCDHSPPFLFWTSISREALLLPSRERHQIQQGQGF
jgi:hypothetical protein